MSLEQTLERTNTLLEKLLSVLTTGLEAQAEFGQPEEKKTRTRKVKDTAVAEVAAPAAAPVEEKINTDLKPIGVVEGDPEGTRYWVIEKHNTVYAEKPGDPAPNVQGAVIVSPAEYLQKKAEYAALGKSAEQPPATAVEAPATAPAQAPAPATPGASTAQSQDSTVPFPKIVERITALNKSDKPGHGREGVLSVLRQFLPGDEKPTVTKLQALNRNTEVLEVIEALLAGPAPAPAADEFDPLA